jgi:hypothetical protein
LVALCALGGGPANATECSASGLFLAGNAQQLWVWHLAERASRISGQFEYLAWRRGNQAPLRASVGVTGTRHDHALDLALPDRSSGPLRHVAGLIGCATDPHPQQPTALLVIAGHRYRFYQFIETPVANWERIQRSTAAQSGTRTADQPALSNGLRTMVDDFSAKLPH